MARPKRIEPIEEAPKPFPTPFTGVAYSCECFKEHGTYSNFRILTLFIVAGEIVHVERTAPHATFEVIDIADVKMHRSIHSLNSRYKDGLTIGLGGEDLDSLVNRLKKTNPEVLERISPALGLKSGALQ